MRYALPVVLLLLVIAFTYQWFDNAGEHYAIIQNEDTSRILPPSNESEVATVTVESAAVPDLILTGILSVNDKYFALIRINDAPAHSYSESNTITGTLVVAEINQHSVMVKDTVAMIGWELELMTQSTAMDDSHVQITAAQTDVLNDNDAPSPFYGYDVINGVKVVAMDLEPGQSRTFYQPPNDNDHSMDEDSNRPASEFDPGQTVTFHEAPPKETYQDEDNDQLASFVSDNTGQSITLFAPPPTEAMQNQQD